MSSQFARYPSLDGMPVVISGGASGIGETIVREFAAQGAKVGFVDIAGERGAALEAELIAAGHTAKFARCDITDTAAYQATIRGFEAAHGPALALVNNAANDQRIAWNEVTEEAWDKAVNVNLRHAFFAAQAVIPGMIKAGRGSIVNFGSISWMILTGNLTAYTASKAAAHGMSRSLARDLGQHGIRVNTLVPGWIMTERQLTHWVGDAENALIDAQQALKGRLYPADIARMAMFLAADDSQMISGQDFLVDGGWAHG
ncbi:MAG: SDR family oxidoreductase [Devosia sp.]|uniref:SDR family NAD(P)-dependent oxidoreductase n=1 Tax=Devosia sp. 66-22 TaxID=1895753 RepID=UPI00092792DC|nr:SDR family oxidoreductase [Devosia sp. 66-22]MBN9345855.1 SDR family oxidoreductase [Devosia sp.]OJX48960.1 MAG: 3-oxoacyl-ACP reductase [Devosia sp. 66-22]